MKNFENPLTMKPSGLSAIKFMRKANIVPKIHKKSEIDLLNSLFREGEKEERLIYDIDLSAEKTISESISILQNKKRRPLSLAEGIHFFKANPNIVLENDIYIPINKESGLIIYHCKDKAKDKDEINALVAPMETMPLRLKILNCPA